MTETERRILEMQAPSTRKCLERPRDLDTEWLNRKIPKEAQVVKEDGTVDLSIRHISKEDKEFYDGRQGMRRKQGGWFEQARTSYLMAKAKEGKINARLLGNIETPHVLPTPVKKERAIDSFMNSRTVAWVKDAFHKLMSGIRKEKSYAEVTAEHMKKVMDDK